MLRGFTGGSGLRRLCVLPPLCSKAHSIFSGGIFLWGAEAHAIVSCAAENWRTRCTDLGVAFGTDLIARGIRA